MADTRLKPGGSNVPCIQQEKRWIYSVADTVTYLFTNRAMLNQLLKEMLQHLQLIVQESQQRPRCPSYSSKNSTNSTYGLAYWFCFYTLLASDNKVRHSRSFVHVPATEQQLSFGRSLLPFKWHQMYTGWTVNRKYKMRNWVSRTRDASATRPLYRRADNHSVAAFATSRDFIEWCKSPKTWRWVRIIALPVHHLKVNRIFDEFFVEKCLW